MAIPPKMPAPKRDTTVPQEILGTINRNDTPLASNSDKTRTSSGKVKLVNKMRIPHATPDTLGLASCNRFGHIHNIV